MSVIDCNTFLNSYKDIPILDVRAPGEFLDGHIPNAVSFPLFTDAERAEIGTLYKQVSQESAIARGREIAVPKIPLYLARAKELGQELKIHCWRGGMRSQKMAELLEENGHRCQLLKGGYKAYRQNMFSFFSQPMKFKVLTGYTGSMKTEVLLAMKELGAQVIDLEGAANHQGSSFGNAHTTGQPTTEHFQNLLYEVARTFDLERPIWLEDESFIIGKCVMPNPLFEQKQASPHIHIRISDDQRLDHLVRNYGKVDPEKLTAAMMGIKRKLGHQQCDRATKYINQGNFREAAAIALVYYDKQYGRSLERKKEMVVAEYHFDRETPEEIARHLYDGS